MFIEVCMNKCKCLFCRIIYIVLAAVLATGTFIPAQAAKKKHATSGIAPITKALWNYDKKTKTLTIKPNNKKKKEKPNTSDFKYRLLHTKNLVYKEGINRIDEFSYNIDTLRDYRGFSEVEIPGSIKRITPDSFMGAPNLQSMTMKNGVEQIGFYALGGGNYKEMVFPNSMKCVEEAAFEMTNNKHIEFNDGLESVGWCAFDYSSLTDVILPDSVNHIGREAFRCSDIKYIKLPDGLNVLSDGVLAYNEQLKSCNIPESIVEIRYCVFRDTGLERITIPRNVEILGREKDFWAYEKGKEGCFSDCKSLKRMTFKTKKIKNVYEGAMSGIGDDVVIEVPTGYKDKYSKLFVQGGLNKNVKIVEIDVNDSDIDSVRLNRENAVVKAGMPRKMELLYADEPDKVMWESSDESVVSIDARGEARAIKTGDAIIKASYKNREFLCSVHVIEADSDNDEEALRKLIKYQRELGSLDVAVDIHSDQYEWRDGRLIGINWSRLDVAGAIDLNEFTYLEYFKSGYKWCGIWKIDADDLEHLKFLGYNQFDIGENNIHIENAKGVIIEKYAEGHMGYDFGDSYWRNQPLSD